MQHRAANRKIVRLLINNSLPILVLIVGFALTAVLTVGLYKSQVRQQIDQTLTGINFAAEQTNQLIHFLQSAAGVVGWQVRNGTAFSEIQLVYPTLLTNLDALRTILVVDPNGTVVADLQSQSPMLGADVSDEQYFLLARDAPEGQILLSAPIAGPIENTQSYPMSSAVYSVDGNLLAIVVVLVKPQVFDAIMREFVGLSDMRLMLVDQARGVVAPVVTPQSGTGGTANNATDAPRSSRPKKSAWGYKENDLIVAKSIEDHLQISLLVRKPMMEIRSAALQSILIPALLGVLLALSLAVVARQFSEKNRRIKSGETLIAATSENIPGAIMRYSVQADGAMDVQYISEGCEDIWEHRASEMRKDMEVFWASVDPEDLTGLRASFQTANETLDSWSHRWRITTPSDATKWLNGRGVPSRLPDGSTMWNSVILDVTDLMEAQLELAENREVLAFSHRLESVGRLTAGVAHEFNNLMAAIMGNIELALDAEHVQEKEARAFLQDALVALQRGARQTSDLLKFGRKARLNPEILTLNSAVGNLQSILQSMLPENIEIDFDLCVDPWTTKLDAAQLEGAILNLVINARDALHTGGKILISTDNVTMTEAESSDVPPGDYVTLTVSDDGVGMAPDVLENAIDPYFTTKPVGEGTGLGLSVVHGFVKQSEGHLQVQSTEGLGTFISLWFLRDEHGQVHSEPAAQQLNPPDDVEGSEVILLVEDNPEVSLTLRRQLTSLGYRVITCHDGATALELIRNDPSIDILLSDIVMPGEIQGDRLAEIVMIENPALPVMLLTGYAGGDEQDRFKCPVIGKPVGTRALGAAIRAHLRQFMQARAP